MVLAHSIFIVLDGMFSKRGKNCMWTTFVTIRIQPLCLLDFKSPIYHVYILFRSDSFKYDICKRKLYIIRNKRFSNNNRFRYGYQLTNDSRLWLYMRYTIESLIFSLSASAVCVCCRSDTFPTHKYLCVTIFDSVVCMFIVTSPTIYYSYVYGHGATMARTHTSPLPSNLTTWLAAGKKPMYFCVIQREHNKFFCHSYVILSTSSGTRKKSSSNVSIQIYIYIQKTFT